jgi:hypothetical protein
MASQATNVVYHRLFFFFFVHTFHQRDGGYFKVKTAAKAASNGSTKNNHSRKSDQSTLPFAASKPKVAFQYGLVFLVIAYLQAIQVPTLIQIYIESHTGGISTVAPTTKSTGPSILPDGFNDAAFMAKYKCNQAHEYFIDTIKEDPKLMLVRGFLAPGEGEHLLAIGFVMGGDVLIGRYPKMARSTVVGTENHVHDARTSSSAFLGKSQDKVHVRLGV